MMTKRLYTARHERHWRHLSDAASSTGVHQEFKTQTSD